MAQAIGSFVASAAAPAGASVGLRAQLADYQKQLSECVNCASAKTLEGKAQIQALSDKIGDIKARLDRLAAPDTRRVEQAAASASADNNASRSNGVIGSLLDVTV
jgi:hypothetical protein